MTKFRALFKFLPQRDSPETSPYLLNLKHLERHTWYKYLHFTLKVSVYNISIEKILLEGTSCVSFWVIHMIINSNTTFKTHWTRSAFGKNLATMSHYLLQYHNCTNEESTFLDSIKEIGPLNLTKSYSYVTSILLLDINCLLHKWILTS